MRQSKMVALAINIFTIILLSFLFGYSDGSTPVNGYTLYPNKKPSARPRMRFSGVESAETCAQRCAASKRFSCTTFSLRTRGMRCILYSNQDTKSIGVGIGLINSNGFFTYEMEQLEEESKALTECLPDVDPLGINYKGTKSTTSTGRTCQRWDSNKPHIPKFTPPNTRDHKNYCRNPDKDQNGPWCYTTDPVKRWGRCSIPNCRDAAHKGATTEAPLTTTRKPECFVCNGYDYRGRLSVTGSGKTCQRWDSSTPHQHSNHPNQKPGRHLEENFCRNPDGDSKPWCYTTDRATRWEYCQAERCTNPDGSIFMPPTNYTTECVVGSGAPYRGTTSRTKSGKTCANWNSQSPHTHKKTPEEFPCSGLDGNYCRNPSADFGNGAWCYTTDPNTRWELCDIPKCGPGGRPITTTTTTTRAPTTQATGSCGVAPIQPSFRAQPYNIIDSVVVERTRIKRSFAISNRILGGDVAVHGSWPWTASIRYYNVHFCGGSLIDLTWVLTASHCLDDDTQPRLLSIKVGHDRGSEPEMQTRQVRRYMLHEGYTKNNVEHDIALIQLEGPVHITDYVRIACLPPIDYEVPGGSNCVVAGWGATHDPKYQNQLKQAVLPVNSYQDCLRYLGNYMRDKTQMCAGSRGKGHDTCRGDSGGPLVCLNNDHWTVQGVTSWGSGCESKQGSYGSYTRVSKYIHWIKNKMNKYN